MGKGRGMENKIEDLEYAIDSLESAIRALKEHKEYKRDVADLEIYKSALEDDLNEAKKEYEELSEEEEKEARRENMEQERQYWKEAM